MKNNVGTTDRIIRIALAAVIAVLYFTDNWLTGTIGIVALALAVIFVLTSLVSFCPIYAIFGIRSCPAR